MKRTLTIAAFFAMGLLVANSFAAAQDAPPTTSGGQVTIGFVQTPGTDSSKFNEYRDIRNGFWIPYLNLFTKSSTLDLNLAASNIGRDNQHLAGWANLNWVGVSFDYNQTPHNIGNNGHSLWVQTAPGVWSMDPLTRQTLGDLVDAIPAATRPRDWNYYLGLMSPLWPSMNPVDVKGTRKRGEFAADFSQKLPFDLKFTYVREVKLGNRGESMGGLYGVTSTVVDVPDAMNEVTTDYGANFAYNFKGGDVFKGGNVHAAFNRNIYNDRQASLIIDNPFRATDLAYTTVGGPAQGRWSTPPDNEASRFAVGFLFKLQRQTRFTGDYTYGTWTQNQQYLPYTINSTILTTAGAPANNTSALLQQSLNGKINTTMVNVSAGSKPIDNLTLRLRYRLFDQANKTAPLLWPGTAGGTMERSWGAPPTGGFPTSTIYSYKTGRFDAQVGYDLKAVGLEFAYHDAKIDRVGVEATGAKDTGFMGSAVVHAADWLGFRAMYDESKQTASGFDKTLSQFTATPATSTYMGLPNNESERKRKRIGFDVELEPVANLGLTFAYFRRTDDYPNRPARDNYQLDPKTTSSGLLSAEYNTYTAELDFTPSENVELNAFYTFEKNLAVNRWTTLVSATATTIRPIPINNSVQYNGNDKTTSYGVNGVFQLVPEKWKLAVSAVNQKVDGFMGVQWLGCNCGTFGTTITGNFQSGRAAFGGPQSLNDWDDTLLTTIKAELEHNVTKAWSVLAGYMYEKYTYADPYTSGTLPMPVQPVMALKLNAGDYEVGVVYVKLNYRF